MTHSILAANLLTMSMNLLYAVLAIFVGAFAYKIIDRFIFPEIDFIKEVQKGNIAAGIVVAAAVLFLALILSSAVR